MQASLDYRLRPQNSTEHFRKTVHHMLVCIGEKLESVYMIRLGRERCHEACKHMASIHLTFRPHSLS